MKSVELNISKKNNTEKGEKEKGRKGERESGSELPYFASISTFASKIDFVSRKLREFSFK